MKKKVGMFIFLLFLFSACGTPGVTETAIQIKQTQTPNLFMSPTFSPKPTSTLEELTQTLILFPEQSNMTATQQVLRDTLGRNCTYGSAEAIRLSPNGVWAEAICGLDSIIIIHIDRRKEWSLSSDSLIGLYTEDFVHVSHWSNDGTHAYIGVDPHTDGYWEPFHQGMVLYRLNLETGEIREVLPLGKSNRTYYSFSFSPNDRRLAYIVTDQSPVILNMRDMQTGIEESFQFDSKYNTGGGFVWSPDSQQLVFSITQFDTTIYEYVDTSIILWDEEMPNPTTLIKDHKEILMPVEWINESKILLQVLYQDEAKYQFDMISGELKSMNP